MSIELTARQSEILSFLRFFLSSHSFPPTIREIAEHFQIAPASALGHLHALEVKGFIRRYPAKPRCMEIIKN